MIKIKKLVKYWECCGSNNDDAINEYNKLVNAIWLLYNNGVIEDLERDKELKKLGKTLMEYNGSRLSSIRK